MFLRIFTFPSLEIHSRINSLPGKVSAWSPRCPKQSPYWGPKAGTSSPTPHPATPNSVFLPSPLHAHLDTFFLKAQPRDPNLLTPGLVQTRPGAPLPAPHHCLMIRIGGVGLRAAFHHPAPHCPSPGAEGRDYPPPPTSHLPDLNHLHLPSVWKDVKRNSFLWYFCTHSTSYVWHLLSPDSAWVLLSWLGFIVLWGWGPFLIAPYRTLPPIFV